MVGMYRLQSPKSSKRQDLLLWETTMTAADADRERLPRAFYTVAEFCERNSIGKTLFYELVQAGDIQVVHVGRRSLVPAASEAAWHAKILPATVPVSIPRNSSRIPATRSGHQRPKIRYRPLKNGNTRTGANDGG